MKSSNGRTGGTEDEDAPLELPAVVVLWGDDGGRREGGEELGEEGGHAGARKEESARSIESLVRSRQLPDRD